jgi:hypothetical protein
MTTQIYAGVREILTAPDWDTVYVTDHGPFVTIAGRFNGKAHAGSRDDWRSLAIDMDRIARAQYAELLAEAEQIADEPVEAAPEPEPEPVLEVTPEPVVIEEAPAYVEPEPEPVVEAEPEPCAELVQEIDALKDELAEAYAELNRLRTENEHKFPASLDERMSDYAPVPDVALDDETLTTADLTEEVIQRLTQAKRKKWTELLNVELAELQQERGGPNEALAREAECERLLGLFARVGEL